MKKLLIALALSACIPSANAALIDRAGGFVYDDVLDITWLQDANVNDQMNWPTAVSWADNLSVFDSVRGVTHEDWRLPTTLQPDPSCTSGNTTGFNCTGSEMGHLYNVHGGQLGLFTNLQPSGYWSGTENAASDTPTGVVSAWAFEFGIGGIGGFQYSFGKASQAYALAVRDGDVGIVPIPPAVWLFGSALGLLGWVRARAK